MTVYRPPAASCTIRVFKSGLLSRVGHDIELRVGRFSIQIEDEAIHAEFDGTSLEVVGALQDGEVVPGKLSDKDKRDIIDNIRRSVFKKHDPKAITFECEDLERTEDGIEGTGTLTIPPVSREIDFEADRVGDHLVCTVTLHQPDFGITPYSAPLGVLRIQPDIEVRVEVPVTD
ncbi:MAG: YceI family protein [Deltaproteobacteria bacterium]|nr:MAG: YceI family protein [Deltaproteobacteria bacterium]